MILMIFEQLLWWTLLIRSLNTFLTYWRQYSCTSWQGNCTKSLSMLLGRESSEFLSSAQLQNVLRPEEGGRSSRGRFLTYFFGSLTISAEMTVLYMKNLLVFMTTPISSIVWVVRIWRVTSVDKCFGGEVHVKYMTKKMVTYTFRTDPL